jgi:MFS family permease
MEHTSSELSTRQTRAILAVMAIALMAVVSAVSGLNVALPSLARDTGASQTQLTWIVDAYTVVFAGLLLLAGALGDRYGRKGLLLLGLVIFGGAAAVGMMTTDPTQLIVVRAFMGVGAAAIMPTTLSILTNVFPAEERPKAIGIWAAVAGIGVGIGPAAGGFLLEQFDWGSVFIVTLPLVVVAFPMAAHFVPAHVNESTERVDNLGGVLSIALVAALILGEPTVSTLVEVSVGRVAAATLGVSDAADRRAERDAGVGSALNDTIQQAGTATAHE